jgi:hypothetical protein
MCEDEGMGYLGGQFGGGREGTEGGEVYTVVGGGRGNLLPISTDTKHDPKEPVLLMAFMTTLLEAPLAVPLLIRVK